jgi:putative SOS response-associated peptidase YedK
MCANFNSDVSEDELKSEYAVEIGGDARAKAVKKDVRITDEAWVITADEPEKAQQMHFGLVAWYAKECTMERDTFNAKKENLLSSRLWGPLMRQHKRCIIITTGFMEPQATPQGTTKHWKFKLKDRKVFSVAGLWSEWRNPHNGSVYRSFAMITTVANNQVAEVHQTNRMPAALTKEQEGLWLSKSLPTMQSYLDLLTTMPDENITRDQTHKPGANEDESQTNLF